MEIFKDIEGFEHYMVSSEGNIKSLKSSKRTIILKPAPAPNGYLHVGLFRHNRSNGRMIHRLVAETFLERSSSNLEVNHINGIKTDNRVENLEWVTKGENTLHALKTGLKIPIKGEALVTSKLTEKKVIEIRNLKGIKKAIDIGREYGIHSMSVNKIWRKKTWKHVAV